LRLLVRERLSAGDSDGQVLDFLVARYGQFVLLKPQFGASTFVLWVAPFLVVLIGIGIVAVTLRRRRPVLAPPRPLAAEEQRRLEELTH
jgi:cytochrome c-type biogenesis protein CcmH